MLLTDVLLLGFTSWFGFYPQRGLGSAQALDLIVVLDGGSSRLVAAAAPPAQTGVDRHRPSHTARAVLSAQIALGPRGIQVGPPPPPPCPIERRKLVRDAFRLQLWLATGSTGAWLAPERHAKKRASCGL